MPKIANNDALSTVDVVVWCLAITLTNDTSNHQRIYAPIRTNGFTIMTIWNIARSNYDTNKGIFAYFNNFI